MVQIKSTNEIILDLIDFFNSAQPNADIKPGTVFRDLAIEAPASTTALLYNQLAQISNLQSLRLVSGSDLDKLAQNFGATRKSAKKSSGVALLTFNTIPATIGINAGSLLTASSGATFSIVNGTSIDPSQANYYKSIAVKYANNLSFLNITDQYAVEVTAQATTAGSAGNISQYSINQVAVPGISNATNVFPFTQGTDQEDDPTFRNRVLAIFSGSNVGTSLGYQNLALSNSSVLDAIVVGPGNSLMTRDGTQVIKNSDGTFTIIQQGTGGKVDIYILGSNLTQFTDTFIYLDKSNTNDPTNSANNIVLGQIASDVGLTVTQKRLKDIAANVLPAQPVENVIQVTGSLSGPNFIPATTDNLGRTTGNYSIVKDTGAYAGSPWGFDQFVWKSNQISFNEDRIKAKFNGQDATTFTDVLQIPQITQNISITNENSIVEITDRSMIQLLHTPATNVSRVFNVNTGETYTIINQNPNGTSTINTSGVIQISGNTLPASNDILQVDYTWIVSYDPFSDYDGKILKNNPRPSIDSIDWGIANAVRNERVLFALDPSNAFYTGTVKHPITSIISANKFSFSRSSVTTSTIPNFIGRLQISLSAVDNPINSIESIFLTNSNIEVYNTAQNNGQIINTTVIVGIQIKTAVVIILPTDTSAQIGDFVSITYNQSDVFNIVNSTGSFTSNQITVPSSNIAGLPSTVYLDIAYIAALQDLFNVGITSIPMSRIGNGYVLDTTGGSQNIIKSNTIRKENQTIQSNGSDGYIITLNCLASDFSLTTSQIISVIDLVSNKEIWGNDGYGAGTISTASNGNYQLTFSGYNSPNIGDNVLILYFADDIRRFQPFTFNNNIIKIDYQNLLYNFSTNNFYCPAHNFTNEINIKYQIIDNTTGIVIDGYSDGYISGSLLNGQAATFGSASINFANVDDLLGKTIKLINTVNVNNKGSYIISAYNSNNNTITIQNALANLNINQVSIIRIADGKDLWKSTGNIDTINNKLNLPQNTLAVQGDLVAVIYFTNKNLHQSPTKLSITVADQITNTGIITTSGTTITEVQNVVFTAINNGLTQNALEAFKTFLNLSSVSSIANNNYIVRIMAVSKVSATTDNQVLETLINYDVDNTLINNNIYYANEMLLDTSLSNTQFTLPSTTNNINNAPKIGDKLQISFYFATDNDFENVYFTRNGTLYTNKKFAFVDQFYISSGFSASQSAKFTTSFFTQPLTGLRYTTYYNYLAPKPNERILIQYNYNALVGATTFTVEASRPITADVLIKEAQELLIDATLNVVVSSNATTSAAVILQNVKNAVISAINTNKLGDTISSSQILSSAQSVSGVERVRILGFNTDGNIGQVLTISAQENQYFVANIITVNQESI